MTIDLPGGKVPPELSPEREGEPATGPFLSLVDRGRTLLIAVLILVILSVPVTLLLQPDGGRGLAAGFAMPLVVAILAAAALAILIAPLITERRARPTGREDAEQE